MTPENCAFVASLLTSFRASLTVPIFRVREPTSMTEWTTRWQGIPHHALGTTLTGEARRVSATRLLEVHAP